MSALSEFITPALSSADSYSFDFDVPIEHVRNANGIGYAKTARQQSWLNRKRNESKQALKAMGESIEWNRPPLTRCIADVQVVNTTHQRFDPDNIQLTYKALMDGMVSKGVMEDDNSHILLGTLFREWEGRERTKGVYHLRVTLYDLSGGAGGANDQGTEVL